MKPIEERKLSEKELGKVLIALDELRERAPQYADALGRAIGHMIKVNRLESPSYFSEGYEEGYAEGYAAYQKERDLV